MPRGTISGTRRTPQKIRNPRIWDAGVFKIHDSQGVKRVLGRALAQRFVLFWNEDADELQSLETGEDRAEVRRLLRLPLEERIRQRVQPHELQYRTKSDELKRAAHWFGISYSVLHRLAHAGKREKTPRTISWRTAHRLQQKLEPEEWEELEEKLFSPETRRLQREYRDFVDRESERLAAGRDPDEGIDLFGRLRAVVEEFERRAQNKGVPANRAHVATLRVLTSLYGWPRMKEAIHGTDAEIELVRLGYRLEAELLTREMRLLHKEA